MNFPLIDTHAHLDQTEFDQDRAEVIFRGQSAGITNIIAIGITAASSQACLGLAREHAAISAAVGIQPNYVAEAAADDWDQIVKLAGESGAVAIGETGLDRHWTYSPFELQQDYFDRHLRLAQAMDLPLVIHTRESDQDVLLMLRDAVNRGPIKGVMHSFTGNAQTAAECVELGLHISFAGMVTFKKSQALRDVAKTIPAGRLLVETDSPYLSPDPFRGRRNEPAHLVHTASCLAQARSQSLEEFAAMTTANAKGLFRLT